MHLLGTDLQKALATARGIAKALGSPRWVFLDQHGQYRLEAVAAKGSKCWEVRKDGTVTHYESLE